MDQAKEYTQLNAEEAAYLSEHGGTTRFDNDGNAVIENRAARRRKPLKLRNIFHGRVTVPNNALTKSTHSIRLARAESKKVYRKTH